VGGHLTSKLLFVVLVVLALLISGCCCCNCSDLASLMPREETITIGTSDYPLSLDAQQYMMIYERSDYECDRYILIIEEPHYERGAQYSLYKGLEIFFNDSPSLLKKTIFLAEGVPSGTDVSVASLVEVEPNPDDELIEDVLNTYLINGYIAYDWKTGGAIPIVGIEDEELYNLSAKLWVDIYDDEDDSGADLWQYSVRARNEEMADTLLSSLGSYENPVLFIGSLHVKNPNDLDDIDYSSPLASGYDLARLKQHEARDLYDYLKEQRIGYTLVIPFSGLIETFSSDEGEQADAYKSLFEAQMDGEEEFYMTWLACRQIYENGVTVRPSPDMAAVYASMLAAGESQDSGPSSDSQGEENKDKKPDNKDKSNLLNRLLNALKNRRNDLLNKFKDKHPDAKLVDKFNPNDKCEQIDGEHYYHWHDDPNHPDGGGGNGPHWDRGRLDGRGPGQKSPDGLIWHNK